MTNNCIFMGDLKIKEDFSEGFIVRCDLLEKKDYQNNYCDYEICISIIDIENKQDVLYSFRAPISIICDTMIKLKCRNKEKLRNDKPRD